MLTRSDLHVPPLSPRPSLLHSGISQLSLDQVILVSSSVLSPSTWLPTPFSNLKSCCAPSQAGSRGHFPAPHLLLPPTSFSLLSPSLKPSLLFPLAPLSCLLFLPWGTGVSLQLADLVSLITRVFLRGLCRWLLQQSGYQQGLQPCQCTLTRFSPPPRLFAFPVCFLLLFQSFYFSLFPPQSLHKLPPLFPGETPLLG